MKSLVFIALLAAAPALAQAPEPRTLSMAGHGEVKAAPDQVEITAGVTTSATTAAAALSANTARMKTVFAAHLRSGRRKRMLAMAGAAFLMLLLVAAGVALVVIRRAQRESDRQAEVAKNAAALAHTAEAEARQRLVQVQAKEVERQAAAHAAEVAGQALAKKNGELTDALERAELAKAHAKRAQHLSERNARAAKKKSP